MLSIGLVGYAVCFSTEPDSFLKGLVAWRFPFSLAFMAVSAIQFVPVAAEQFVETRAAMRLKGYRTLRLGIRQTVRTEMGGLRAVLAGTIRHSEEKALSILTRGFDIEGPRTSFEEDRLKSGEVAFIFALLVPVLALGAVKVLFWLYQAEIFYSSGLRGIYAFTREWL
jgi:energy-coupling factor transporter transmembrane protein EcfT